MLLRELHIENFRGITRLDLALDRTTVFLGENNTGKTSVLAERCVHLVCDADEKCGVDELLVVTFTETAAAEMKSRIAQALAKRHARRPSDHTARQLAIIDTGMDVTHPDLSGDSIVRTRCNLVSSRRSVKLTPVSCKRC